MKAVGIPYGFFMHFGIRKFLNTPSSHRKARVAAWRPSTW
ncbi:hypothetical protein C900_05221 [Fulvivirga imtechensis AK7]|uniref:Uncharacterized protein n=1 Tax=Fulvivirga imtechensis AK7 TaxID=1237149 RepID=L8K143_9BACT|nr:hypothetical protein C900_05221 [Fulvivirga imtechensis AK7]